MVFAIETYAPATDGFPAARMRKRSGHDKGRRLISLFPAEELPISAKY
jgi:Xaa-Pro dipeptidase